MVSKDSGAFLAGIKFTCFFVISIRMFVADDESQTTGNDRLFTFSEREIRCSCIETEPGLEETKKLAG